MHSELRRILAESIHRDMIGDPENNTPSLKQIAADSDIHIDNLYKYGSEDDSNEPRLSQFARIYRASNGGLFRTLRLFVSLCDSGLVLEHIPASETNGSITDEIVDMTIAGGTLAERLTRAFEDGRIELVEVNDIMNAAEEMQRVLDRIKDECLLISIKSETARRSARRNSEPTL